MQLFLIQGKIKKYRVHTQLDEMHSALATVALAGEMAKTLKEELKGRQSRRILLTLFNRNSREP